MLNINLRRVADTKNCVRYEAPDDTVIKSALYFKIDALTEAFGKIPDSLLIQAVE